MPKNIIVLSDGTGQEGGEGNNTNVYKLYNILEDRTPDQIAFYDPGLGTGIQKFTGNGAGMGISKNIKDCYRFIFDHYESGDRIYLLGFSRGATTVRSLAGFIDMFGILPKARPELIHKAWKIYRIKDSAKEKKLERHERKRYRKAAAFVDQHHTMWVKIEFLGVWDTVAALGVPLSWADYIIEKVPFFKHKFHELGLSASMKHVYHALAIDDQRMTFHPEIWHPVLEGGVEEGEERTLLQVWFAGMHTDVGGGYKESELSDIVLDWMLAKAQRHGLRLYKRQELDLNPNGHMHDSRAGYAFLFRKKERTWDSEQYGKPILHWSVIERTYNVHNKPDSYVPWIAEIDHLIEDKNENIVTIDAYTAK